MPHAYEIVHSVLEKHRGTAPRLADLTDKSEEIYRSHGREPRTQNAMANGNVSPVTHFMRYVRLYDAATPGAGQMLSHRVYEALSDEFAERSVDFVTQSDLQTNIEDEGVDIRKWLINFKLDEASINQHKSFQDECDEAIEAIMAAKSASRVKQRELQLKRGVREFAGGAIAAKRSK